jgi:drug/metabolite transporter (DMT)-like permease
MAYLGVIIIWSTTPLAIKWSGETTGFLLSVTGRMVLSTILCLLLIVWLRVAFPWHRAARLSYFAASIGIYGALISTYWAAQFIPSALISVLFGLAPIVTSVLTMMWLGDRFLSLNKWLGMGLGVIGLAFIFNSDLAIGHDSIKGLFAILFAIFLHSFSAVWVKRLNVTLSPLALTGGGLLMALPLYGITWLIWGEPLPTTFSSRSVFAIIYLGIFGSVIGFILYYYLIKKIDVKQVALTTLITPIIALFLGQNLNGEAITPDVWLGSGIVLSGLALYQWGEGLIKKISAFKASL